MNFTENPMFQLGQIVATPLIIMALERAGQVPDEFLKKHQSGDWGDMCEQDKQSNEEATANEGEPDKQQRVFSAYKTNAGEKIWVITEHDRSVTTLLLPDEY